MAALWVWLCYESVLRQCNESIVWQRLSWFSCFSCFFLNNIFAITFFYCDIFCFTYAFLCCGMFYFQFGYASHCVRLNESSHESLEWLISWLTEQVIGSHYESLVVLWIVFTWYKRVVSWLYSLVKLYTTKLLLHFLILKLLPKGHLGLRKGLERTTDPTFITKVDQVVTVIWVKEKWVKAAAPWLTSKNNEKS